MAIVQPSAGGDSIRIKLGEAPEAATGLAADRAEPAQRGVRRARTAQHTLELRVFDGTGGEPPTDLRAHARRRPANADANAERRRDETAGAPTRRRRRPRRNRARRSPLRCHRSLRRMRRPAEPNTRRADGSASASASKQRRAQLRQQAQNHRSTGQEPVECLRNDISSQFARYPPPQRARRRAGRPCSPPARACRRRTSSAAAT